MLPDYDPEYVDYLFSRIVHDMSEKYIIEIFTKYFDYYKDNGNISAGEKITIDLLETFNVKI